MLNKGLLNAQQTKRLQVHILRYLEALTNFVNKTTGDIGLDRLVVLIWLI